MPTYATGMIFTSEMNELKSEADLISLVTDLAHSYKLITSNGFKIYSTKEDKEIESKVTFVKKALSTTYHNTFYIKGKGEKIMGEGSLFGPIKMLYDTSKAGQMSAHWDQRALECSNTLLGIDGRNPRQLDDVIKDILIPPGM